MSTSINFDCQACWPHWSTCKAVTFSVHYTQTLTSPSHGHHLVSPLYLFFLCVCPLATAWLLPIHYHWSWQPIILLLNSGCQKLGRGNVDRATEGEVMNGSTGFDVILFSLVDDVCVYVCVCVCVSGKRCDASISALLLKCEMCHPIVAESLQSSYSAPGQMHTMFPTTFVTFPWNIKNTQKSFSSQNCMLTALTSVCGDYVWLQETQCVLLRKSRGGKGRTQSLTFRKCFCKTAIIRPQGYSFQSTLSKNTIHVTVLESIFMLCFLLWWIKEIRCR